jgi:rhodanese-related sulfurtransferase
MNWDSARDWILGVGKRCPLLPILLALGWVIVGCGGTARDWDRITADIRREFPTVSQMSTERLAERLASAEGKRTILIDARSPEEYEVSHLEGAILASSPGDMSRTLRSRADSLVVVYCSVGYRSSALAVRLERSGFTEVYNLEGSIFRWANEGRPVYRGGQAVREVHPFDETWGRLLDRSLWRYSP